jgi:hypothetical protein
VGHAAYKLQLPQDSLIHPIFHVSKLKGFTPDFTLLFSKLPMLTKFSQETLQPEAILESGLVKKGNATTCVYQVKWHTRNLF